MTDISVIALSHGLEKNHMMQDYQSNRPSGSNRRDIRAQAALSALIGGKTVMVIAHRMRTVVQADKIIVLDRGSVVEEGSPKELLAKGGSFAHMYSLQTQSGNWEIP